MLVPQSKNAHTIL